MWADQCLVGDVEPVERQGASGYQRSRKQWSGVVLGGNSDDWLSMEGEGVWR